MAREEYSNLIRLDESQREALLDRLDRTPQMSAPSAANSKKASNRRHDKRWGYRLSDIACLVEHPGGGIARLLVCARNLSAGGMSFLHGGFLHPGSACQILLRQNDGQNVALSGRIVSCRHVEGSLHEIGLRFDKRIDPGRFIHISESGDATADNSMSLPSLDGCVLYIDDSPVEQNLMRYYLESCGAQVQIAANGVDGLTFAEQGKFIAIVVELAAPGLTGSEIAQALRGGGSKIPIIAVTADERPETRDHALKMGCNGVLIKPFDLNSLSAMLKKLLPPTLLKHDNRALLAAKSKDERLQPLVATFLKDLDRGMQTLRSAIQASNAEPIRKMCLMLKSAAGGYGFPQIGSLAQDLLQLMDQQKSVQDLREKVGALIKMCTEACNSNPLKNSPPSDSRS